MLNCSYSTFTSKLVYASWGNMHSLVWEMTWVLRDACASGPSLPEDAHVPSKAVKREKEKSILEWIRVEEKGGIDKKRGRIKNVQW